MAGIGKKEGKCNCKVRAKAKCGGLSTTQQTMKLAIAPVEMTLQGEGAMTAKEGVGMTLPGGDVEVTLLEGDFGITPFSGRDFRSRCSGRIRCGRG